MQKSKTQGTAAIQSGFLSIEMMAVLAVILVATTIGMQWLMRNMDDKINNVAAKQMQIMSDATARWEKDNYASILAAANPVATFPDVALNNYLPANFSRINPYGQRYQIRATKDAKNTLQVMLVTTGGETINELNVRSIAGMMGAKGGFVSNLDPGKAQGAFGGWVMPFSSFGGSPGAGKLVSALFIDDGHRETDFLYRNVVPGRPDLNQMNADIDMNGKNLNRVGALNAGGDISTLNNLQAGGAMNAQSANVRGDSLIGGDQVVSGEQRVLKNASVEGYIKPSDSIMQHALPGWGCREGNGALRSTPDGDILTCKNTVWQPVGAAMNGRYISLGNGFDIYNGINNSNNAIIVQASGGNCVGVNGYALYANVNGVGTVAAASDNNNERFKSGFVSFVVPAQTGYQIVSRPYECGRASFTIMAFVYT